MIFQASVIAPFFGLALARYFLLVLRGAIMRNALSAAVLAALSALAATAAAEGIHLDGGEPVVVDRDVVLSTNEDEPKTAVGLTNGSTLSITANADISAQYQSASSNDTGAGVKADSGSVIQLGSSATDHVNVTAIGSYINGIWANGVDSRIEVSGDTLTINVVSDRTLGKPQTSGIYAMTSTSNDAPDEHSATVIVNAENTVINVGIDNNDGDDYAVAAISATSNGVVKINGNLKVTAPYLISTRGNSVISINEANENRTIQLEGVIQYAASISDPNAELDSSVVMNLKGAGSYWTGSLMSYSEEVDLLKLGLSDGAQWNAQADIPDPEAHAVKVNELTLNDGVINTERAGQVVAIGNLRGTGGTLNLAAEKTGDAFSMSSVSVEDAASMNLTVNLVGEGVNADTLTAEDLDQAAKSAVTGAGASSVTQTQRVAEGDLRGAITQQVAADGTVASRSQADNADGTVASRSQADNTKMEALKGVTAASLVQWRNQVNHLTKRLGDVRRQSGDIGAWARVYGGEYKWGDENRVDMTSTTVQAGADARVGDWIVGGAFSYTDSSFDLRNGDGDGELYSLAVYGTRMFESGAYVDFVGRYGYIKNDMKAGNMDLDFDSNAFSVSAEAGHEFKFLGSAFVEPQVELAYGYVQGDDATASNGVKVHQDDYQNLVTRIGVRTGFDFPKDAGTIYAHASYAYDFLGDADGSARKAGDRVSLDEDLGGGWVTYGVGAQFRLGKSTFAYGDLERSTGGAGTWTIPGPSTSGSAISSDGTA